MVRVFSCRIVDLDYICVFVVFAFCVVVLYPGVVFRVRACVGLHGPRYSFTY
jgi:hypothetical protein